MKPTVRCLVLMLAADAVLPQSAQACAACMGDPNSNIAGAANAAVFVMLGLIGCVLTTLGTFGFYLYKRAQSPAPPHVEFAEDHGAQPEGELS